MEGPVEDTLLPSSNSSIGRIECGGPVCPQVLTQLVSTSDPTLHKKVPGCGEVEPVPSGCVVHSPADAALGCRGTALFMLGGTAIRLA